MKLGANLPYDHTVVDPGALREWAQGVEALGFDYILMADHILTVDMSLRDPARYRGERQAYRDPMVLLAYIAACSTRLELVTGVLVLTQRQTVLVAKQAAEIDVLSGGRLRLGIGVGWNPVEFAQLGQDFHTRGRRIEEQIAVLRALWTQESVTFHGRWHAISEAGLNPLPVQRPIPLWMGGSADAVLRRVGRLADGWLPEGRPGGEMKEQIERVRAYARAAGRDAASLRIEARLGLRSGGPVEWSQAVAAWEDLGATGVGISTSNSGCATVQHHLQLLHQFKEALS